MSNSRPWVTFFSQTGTEIYNLSNAFGKYPDAIISNKQNHDTTNSDLINNIKFREHKLNSIFLYNISQKPTLEEYKNILTRFSNPIITLHGYLRIIPEEICNNYEIYNLHPGLISKHPELKGFNPQERAFTRGYKNAGCVIHKVTPGVDDGEIVASGEIGIEGLTLTEVYCSLHDCAFNTWKNFLTDYNIIQSES
jgi:folate-dependent phosphoribosylglycinamide formyltransferase PurN